MSGVSNKQQFKQLVLPPEIGLKDLGEHLSKTYEVCPGDFQLAIILIQKSNLREKVAGLWCFGKLVEESKLNQAVYSQEFF